MIINLVGLIGDDERMVLKVIRICCAALALAGSGLIAAMFHVNFFFVFVLVCFLWDLFLLGLNKKFDVNLW